LMNFDKCALRECAGGDFFATNQRELARKLLGTKFEI
jgi:hypothetical protein